jgi:CubicO group peptidase (beta-lactamase class C family)
MRARLLAALLGTALAAQAEPHPEVDAVVAARIDGDRSGVCVVAVRLAPGPDGGLVEQRADRCASDARRLPAAPGFRFELGSISKAFTGVLLAEMAERGEVSLDDSVQQHLPAGATMPRFEGIEVTLRDLVTHMSGLPGLPPGFRPASLLNPYANVDERLVVGALEGFVLTTPPGERHAYSNWAFMLLSDLLGRRAGKPYDALLAERVLAPLGMNDTAVADNRGLLPGHTSAGKSTPPWDIPGRYGGVGAVRSTPEDMTRLARALLGDVPAATPASLRRALQASVQAQRDVNERLAMGTGWHLIKRPAGPPWVMHNGMTGGFSSALVVDAGGRRAVLVLADAYGGFDDIAYRLLVPAAPLRAPARPVALDRDAAQAVAGRYRLRDGFDIELALDGEALWGQATGQGRFALKQDSRGDYYTEAAELLLRVARDASGKGTELTVLQGGTALRARRVD